MIPLTPPEKIPGVDVPEEDTPITPPLNQVEESLNALATASKLPSYTRTRNVREQFQHAFEMIGGIPRLAHWAHGNPDKFFALYSKLIPAQVTGADGGAIKVELSWINGRDTSGRQSPGQVIDLEATEVIKRAQDGSR
jgi:hypothetical protein